ncbi:MAG: tetratricopeptide repeat protein [Thermodesulfobacteriota bacterium]
MAPKKISRKELLKEPDEFLSTSQQVLDYVRTNPRTVTAIAVVVVAGAIVGLLSYAYMQYHKQQGHELFLKAYAEYRTATLTESAEKEQWEKLFKTFDDLAKEYRSTLPGELSLLYSGHVLYRMQDYQGALERYTSMKSTRLVDEGLGGMVIYHMAMTRMALKDFDTAASLFDQLAKDTNSPYRREAATAIAAIYEEMGKKKEAIQAYRQYLKMFPQAPDAPYVRARIAQLSTQG